MAIQAKELTKDYQYGFSDIDVSVFRTAKGLSPEVVASISKHKNEPEWMLKFRLKALDHFRKRPMPTWGADLSGLDFENIYYYVKPVEEMSRSWDDVPRLHQEHLRSSRHPPGRASVPCRRQRAVRLRGRLSQHPRGSREAGRALQ